jgi:hypothetical protein
MHISETLVFATFSGAHLYGFPSADSNYDLRLNLHKEFEKAFAETNLPERPDYEKANGFLIKARRSSV